MRQRNMDKFGSTLEFEQKRERRRILDEKSESILFEIKKDSMKSKVRLSRNPRQPYFFILD